MSLSEEKLDQILRELELIKKQLKIVPDRETVITDLQSSIVSYQEFAREDLGIEQLTIDNHKSAIAAFLSHSKGTINKDTVKAYLDSNDSDSWKSNQLKALRRYIRDFLRLGNWINEFQFGKVRAKIKEVPTDEKLIQFIQSLPLQVKAIAVVMLTSGLRIGEVLSLKYENVANDINMINASNIHQGKTKHSWISFMTEQASDLLFEYTESIQFDYESESKLFSISQRSVQQIFQKTSEEMGISINPHLLRTVFVEKCTQAKIPDKYIDAFCGRTPQSILAKNYTDYSPQSLRREYYKVEQLLSMLPA